MFSQDKKDNSMVKIKKPKKIKKIIPKCKWTNKKGEPCPWKISPNKTCCKRHAEWENTSTNNPDLKRCSGCKNLFITKDTLKTCNICKKRSAINTKKETIKKQENNKKCIVVNSKSNEPCKHFALTNDDYCSKHQTLKKYNELTEAGNKVCMNWIRGCFNILKKDDASSCKCCKIKQNEKDKNRYNLKKNTANTFHSNENKFMCINCNKVFDNKENKNNKCIKCYEIYKNGQDSRKPREKYNNQLKEYKNRAKNKKKQEWNLTDEEAIALFKKPCHYCGGHENQLSGIDRKNNDLGYTPENSLPSCTLCNMMKRTHNYDNFYKIIDVVSHMCDGRFGFSFKYRNIMNELFECAAIKQSYNSYIINSCNKRNLCMKLTKEDFHYIKTLDCRYCGYFGGTGACGIDRIDSKLDYTLDNCVPCCKTCNYLKKDLTFEEFKSHTNKIYEFNHQVI